jgi:hypothetical protein
MLADQQRFNFYDFNDFNLLDLDLELDLDIETNMMCDQFDRTRTVDVTRRDKNSAIVGRSGICDAYLGIPSIPAPFIQLNEDSRVATSCKLDSESDSQISLYFQNVNRMRSKTCDLFEAVLTK